MYCIIDAPSARRAQPPPPQQQAGRSTARPGRHHSAAHSTVGPRPRGAARGRGPLWSPHEPRPPASTSTAAAAAAAVAAAAASLAFNGNGSSPPPLRHARQDPERGTRIRNFRAGGQLRTVHTGPAINKCVYSRHKLDDWH
jgi:hypothetical protein